MGRFLRLIGKSILDARAAWALVWVNVAVYILCWLSTPVAMALVLDNSAVWSEPWRLLTYMFVQLSPLHLLGNMIALVLAGAWFLSVARRGWQLWAVYIIGGIAGGALSATPPNALILVGASASIFAILAATVFVPPASKLERVYFIGLLIALFAPLIAQITYPLNYVAHFGGILIGIPLGFALRYLNRARPNPLVIQAQQSGFASLTLEQRQALIKK